MKKNIVILLWMAIICCIPSYTHASDDLTLSDTGVTVRGATDNIDLVYDNQWVYYKNDSLQVERRHIESKKREKLSTINLTQINVYDGYVYGYLESDSEEEGIYKLNIKEKSIEKIRDGFASNLIVVDGYIYFKDNHKVGISKMKSDGTMQEEIYKGHVESFVMYDNDVYIYLEGKLARISTDGTDFLKYNNKYNYNDAFTIYNNFIYVYADVENEEDAQLLRLSLDGKRIKKVLGNVDTVDGKIHIYNELIFIKNYDELSYMPLDGKEQKIITNDIDEFIIAGRYMFLSLQTKRNGLQEIWSIDLDTMSKKRVVPNHYADYDTIETIMTQYMDKRKDIEVVGEEVSIDIRYTKKKISEKIELKNIIDYKANGFYSDYQEDDTSFELWFTKENNLLMSFDGEDNAKAWYHFYGQDIEENLRRLTDNKIVKEENKFDFARSGKLKESKTHYIITMEDMYNDLEWYLFQELYAVNKNVGFSDTLQLTLYINKKTSYIDRVVAKGKKSKETNPYTISVDIKYNYKKTRISTPSMINLILEGKKHADSYIKKANQAFEKEKYKEALKYIEQALKQHNLIKEAYLLKGKIAYAQGNIEEAISFCENNVSMYFDESMLDNEVCEILAECYFLQSDFEKASTYAKRVVYKDDYTNIRMDLIEGISSLNQGYYYTAEHFIDKVLEEEPDNILALKGKIGYLNRQKEYQKCLNLIDEVTIDKSRAVWFYKGLSQFYLEDNDEAFASLNQAVNLPLETEFDMSDDYIYLVMAQAYTDLQNYAKANRYLNKIRNVDDLEFYTETEAAIREEIKYGKQPINKRIADFVGDHYLYDRDVEGFDDYVTEFKEKTKVTPEEVKTFIDSIQLEDDMFTHLFQDIRDEDTEDSDVEYKQLDEETEYIDINMFQYKTGNKVVKIIKDIEEPQKKDLIIDLTGNGGGAVKAAIDILDILLGECTSVYLVNRDGEVFEGKSDYYHRTFRHIYVLIDENSASSSEIVALSLSKFSNNTTLVGRKTFGKGVCQSIFFDRNNKTALYLVSDYWNVLEENIDGIGIQPDVLVEGDTLDDYLEVIRTINK